MEVIIQTIANLGFLLLCAVIGIVVIELSHK